MRTQKCETILYLYRRHTLKMNFSFEIRRTNGDWAGVDVRVTDDDQYKWRCCDSKKFYDIPLVYGLPEEELFQLSLVWDYFIEFDLVYQMQEYFYQQEPAGFPHNPESTMHRGNVIFRY